VNDPIIVSLFKKHGDKELFFSAEVNKVNQYMKFQKRILIIGDKYIYNMHPKNFQIKRAIPLDKVKRVHVSELRDNFLFVHVEGERDYVFNTDRKTEIIQVLKMAKREKIPPSERMAAWFSEGELEIQVSNVFQYSPDKPNVFVPVEFCYDESLLSQEQVIESTKEKLTIRLIKDQNRKFMVDSVVVHIKDVPQKKKDKKSLSTNNLIAAAATAVSPPRICDRCYDQDLAIQYCADCKEFLCELHARAHNKDKHFRGHNVVAASSVPPPQDLSEQKVQEENQDANNDQEVIHKFVDITESQKDRTIDFLSKSSEYQVTVRFRVFWPMDDVKVIHKIKTTGKKKDLQVYNIGNIQFFSSDLGRERVKYMEAKLDPVQLTSAFSGSVRVGITVRDKERKWYKTGFSYSFGKRTFSFFK